MPTYEYVCSSCRHEWEFEQSIKDAALSECPACHHQTARRQISRGTGFILKGSGWYSDLYSSPSNKPASPSESTTSSEGESKPEAKPATDTKPAADTKGSTPTSTTAAASSSAAAA